MDADLAVFVVGSHGAGMSNMLERFKSGKHHVMSDRETGGVAIIHHQVAEIKFVFFNLTGCCRFESLADVYLRQVDLVIIGWDITDTGSLQIAKDWVVAVRQGSEMSGRRVRSATAGIPIALVGMKSDLHKRRAVPFETVAAYAEGEGLLPYRECSALTGEGVQEAVMEPARSTAVRLFVGTVMEPARRKNEKIAGAKKMAAEDKALPTGTHIKVEPHLGVGTYELWSKTLIGANDHFVRFATGTLKLQLDKSATEVPFLGACAWSIGDVPAVPLPAKDAAAVKRAASQTEAAMKAAMKAAAKPLAEARAEEQAAQNALAKARKGTKKAERSLAAAQEQANERERNDLVRIMKNADVVHVVSTPWGGEQRGIGEDPDIPAANRRGGALASKLKQELS